MVDLTTRYVEVEDQAACDAIYKACLANRSSGKGCLQYLLSLLTCPTEQKESLELGYPVIVSVMEGEVVGIGCLQPQTPTFQNPL